jgi:superfamily II DNA or RNA helicase
LGLTQVQFAELMGVSFASVNRWENGQANPSALAWQRIIAAEEHGLEALSPSPPTPKPDWIGASSDSALPIDFGTDSEVVRTVAEAHRLSHGYIFNPAFATEISRIDALPHQRIAVYQHMLMQPRLRFLLADDAGAGKTIMSGLYIREMLSRRLIRRAIIVPPAGLIGNWESELRTLFGLRFKIVTGADTRAANPFIGHDGDLVILSIDTLTGDRTFARLTEAGVAPYDLAVFDEAHKLSARLESDFTIRKTDRYRVAEAIAGARTDDREYRLSWYCRHLLLLTATPHMGKDFPYYALWRLLEPETLSTKEAFDAFPPDSRRHHFIRRTKEEMVDFSGNAIYRSRFSDTFSYDLSAGDVSEQTLYDETTDYIRDYYNRARILNRSAVRLAMSVFQRRLASSTYALMRSFERRLAKLDGFIEDVRAGRLTTEQLQSLQERDQAGLRDVEDEKTADEEQAEDELEENEAVERRAMGAVIAYTLGELEAERKRVEELLKLARTVYERGRDSKFEKLREVIGDPRWRDQKILVFTEHRDTLDFLVRSLEGMGFTGKVAQIHGAMDYLERQDQVDFFRRPTEESGALYMICTDAAAEGINLQFCWLMVNYDIPWNPARLEQRMGRIHRYKQERDVRIINLVAGKTREGRVLKTLLTKLEAIRKALNSDKVFDVIGRLFEGVSLTEYLAQSLTEEGATESQHKIEGTLTEEQVTAFNERERKLYGDGGEVAARLDEQRTLVSREQLRRLLPGYVRSFIEKAASMLGLRIDGDLDAVFSFGESRPNALDPYWPIFEQYPAPSRNRFTLHKPAESSSAVFLHPGESFFELLRESAVSRFARQALRGGVFIDPIAARPYFFHLVMVEAVRRADSAFDALQNDEPLETRLAGLRQDESGRIDLCPIEHLLLMRGTRGIPLAVRPFAATAQKTSAIAANFATDSIARPMAENHRESLLASLSERERFLEAGYRYEEDMLLATRVKRASEARQGDKKAASELERIKERQRSLEDLKQKAIAALRREPELIDTREVQFLAHALVVPSADPEDRKRHDAEVELIAVRISSEYEREQGWAPRDVSKPPLARAVGLNDNPGFDILSPRPAFDATSQKSTVYEERAIEVKGRVGVGDIELTENEWSRACNSRDKYWLYVVYDCGTPNPRLFRVQDPFRKLIATAKGGVIVDESQILGAAVHF